MFYICEIEMVSIFQVLNWLNKISESEHQPTNNVNKIELTDLNFDCMYLIINQLSLSDLLNVVRANEKLSFVAAAVFQHQYHPSSKEFFFEIPPPSQSLLLKNASPRYKLTENRFEVYDMTMALTILKYFGKFIRKFVQTDSPFYPDKYAMLYRYINEYCYESIFDISFNEHFSIFNMTKSFKNVEKIQFIAYNPHNGQSKFISNEMFPSLRHLTLIEIENNCSSHCYLPKLEHLCFYSGIDKSAVKDFLTVNSHIQSIELSGSLDILQLQIIKETLPNLQNITLQHAFSKYFKFHFDTVTTFTIEQCSKYAYDLKLKNLQEFNMQTYGLEDLESWTGFFKKNSNIRRFNLKFQYWRDESFEMIAPFLQDLEDMTISVILEHTFHARVINATTIINFIAQHEKLKRFELDLCECNNDDEAIYRQKLSETWNIKSFDHGHSFERKNAF